MLKLWISHTAEPSSISSNIATTSTSYTTAGTPVAPVDVVASKPSTSTGRSTSGTPERFLLRTSQKSTGEISQCMVRKEKGGWCTWRSPGEAGSLVVKTDIGPYSKTVSREVERLYSENDIPDAGRCRSNTREDGGNFGTNGDTNQERNYEENLKEIKSGNTYSNYPPAP